MKTLEEYLEHKHLEEQYDFIDKEFLDYFVLEWTKNHLPINTDEHILLESKIIYDGQVEQAEIINKEFQHNKNKETIIIPVSKFKNIQNTNFNELYLHIIYTNKDEYAVYKQSDIKYDDYNNVRWNIDKKIFNFIKSVIHK